MNESIPTMIFDIGSYNIRAGLATNEQPKFIIPSAFPTGQHNFEINQPIPPECSPSFAITDGEVDNEDRMTYLFASIFDSLFPSDKPEPTELRVALTNTPYTTKSHVSYISQMCFELLSANEIIMKPPALFTLTQFSLPTCICLDVGYDITHIVPIQENYVCSPAVLRSFAAGSALDLFTAVDQFQLHSVDTWEQMEKARICKEEKAYCSLDINSALDKNHNSYPFTCGELLFQPKLFEAASPEDVQTPDERIQTLMEELPIAQFISTSIQNCDMNCRGKLWGNIIVTGGTSKMKGFRERLQAELEKLAPPMIHPHLIFPDDPSLSAWCGAKLCIDFSKAETWLKKEEYEEDPDSVFQKFIQYGYVDPEKSSK